MHSIATFGDKNAVAVDIFGSHLLLRDAEYALVEARDLSSQ